MNEFGREELYELVWSEPVKRLAERFELSDTGLAKACKRSNIPRPPRGYWAKLSAGKKVAKKPLPPRGPGMADRINIGKSGHGVARTEEEILASNPRPPEFEDELDVVVDRIRALVKPVKLMRMPDRAHRQIRRLLENDEARRQKQLERRYPSSWDDPIFDEPFEKRRLRVLNAIMVALESNGMKPDVGGKEARQLSVLINDTRVFFTLDATTQKEDGYHQASIHSRGSSDKLRFKIVTHFESELVPENRTGF